MGFGADFMALNDGGTGSRQSHAQLKPVAWIMALPFLDLAYLKGQMNHKIGAIYHNLL